jgi:hypothetical protein
MKKYYQITQQENLESIMIRGLLPGVLVGKQNFYGDVYGDNRYIYLYSESGYQMVSSSPFCTRNVALEVRLPEEFPIEIDYDQVLVKVLAKTRYFEYRLGEIRLPLLEIYEINEATKIALTILSKEYFKSYGIDFEGEPIESNIKRFIDKIPNWDSLFGAYRTLQSIPPQYIALYKMQGS